MIVISNHLGNISVSRQFFESLIGGTVVNCFGVVDTNAGGFRQTFVERLPFIRKRRYLGKGVTVRAADGKVFISLHISVLYGVNVASIVKSIQDKVRYAVGEETDLSVEQVDVYVDGIRS